MTSPQQLAWIHWQLIVYLVKKTWLGSNVGAAMSLPRSWQSTTQTWKSFLGSSSKSNQNLILSKVWLNVKSIIQGHLTSNILARWPKSHRWAASPCLRQTQPQDLGWLMCSRLCLNFVLFTIKGGTLLWQSQPPVGLKAQWCLETTAIGRWVGPVFLLFVDH